MRKGFILFMVNAVLIAYCLYSYSRPPEHKDFDINITVENTVSDIAMREVSDALSMFPIAVLDRFTAEDWKVVVLSSIEKGSGTCDREGIVGVISFDDKTITVKGYENLEGATKNVVIHEMSHYLDKYYGNLSATEDFQKVYLMYKDIYKSFYYTGIPETEENIGDLRYAGTSEKEFFAETYKDYLQHPDYLKKNYFEIYNYYFKLKIGEN